MSAEKLIADLESDAFRHGVQQGFWELVLHEGTVVLVRLFAPDQRPYLIQLNCAEYGDEPIAGQFVNEVGQCVADAWPQGDTTFSQWIKHQPGNLFICWDQDRIAIDQHHIDWKVRKAWAKKNQLVSYLNFLSQMLHLPSRGYHRMPPARIA